MRREYSSKPSAGREVFLRGCLTQADLTATPLQAARLVSSVPQHLLAVRRARGTGSLAAGSRLAATQPVLTLALALRRPRQTLVVTDVPESCRQGVQAHVDAVTFSRRRSVLILKLKRK